MPMHDHVCILHICHNEAMCMRIIKDVGHCDEITSFHEFHHPGIVTT